MVRGDTNQGVVASFITADEMTNSTNQSNLVMGPIATTLNEWIKNGKIAPAYLNNQDLSSISNYLLYGETPMMTTPSGKTEINTSLLTVAKSMWSEIDANMKANEVKRAIEKRQKMMTQNMSDNTQNNTSHRPEPVKKQP